MSTQLKFYAYSFNLDVLLVLDTRAVVMERQLCVSICCFIAVPPFVNQGVLNFMKSVEQFAIFFNMYPHKKKLFAAME